MSAPGFAYARPAEWLETLNDLNGPLLDARGIDLRDLERPRDPNPERSPSPIAADPLVESRDAFLRRAAGHWEARASLARQRGYTPIRTAPMLKRDVEWLARHQLGASIADLAAESGSTQDAVRKALTTVRRALAMTARRGPGRPRTAE